MTLDGRAQGRTPTRPLNRQHKTEPSLEWLFVTEVIHCTIVRSYMGLLSGACGLRGAVGSVEDAGSHRCGGEELTTVSRNREEGHLYFLKAHPTLMPDARSYDRAFGERLSGSFQPLMK